MSAAKNPDAAVLSDPATTPSTPKTPTTPARPRGHAAATDGPPDGADEVNDVLRAKCDVIIGVLRKASATDAHGRYKIGHIVRDITASEDKYGKGAVEKVAACVGLRKSTLYSCAKVAGAWTEERFGALVKVANSKGMPLSFCHLVVLAEVGDEEDRGTFTEQALNEALAVDQLRHLIKGMPAKRSPLNVLNHVAPQVKRFTEAMASWRKALTELDGTVDRAALKEALSSGVTKLQALQRLCVDVAAALEEKRKETEAALAEDDVDVVRPQGEHAGMGAAA